MYSNLFTEQIDTINITTTITPPKNTKHKKYINHVLLVKDKIMPVDKDMISSRIAKEIGLKQFNKE